MCAKMCLVTRNVQKSIRNLGMGGNNKPGAAADVTNEWTGGRRQKKRRRFVLHATWRRQIGSYLKRVRKCLYRITAVLKTASTHVGQRT